MFIPRIRHIIVASLLVGVSVGAQAPTPDSVPAARADNYYAAGERLQLATPMLGDVIVAGRHIELNQPVAGDVAAAGWKVYLTARADDDVRVVGADVVIDAAVAGDLTAAGGELLIGRRAHIAGRTWLTGRTVRIDGVVDRDLHIAGADVHIAGELRQPVEIVAESLEILPSAKVLAPIHYKGPNEARVATGATLSSAVRFERIEMNEARQARQVPTGSTLLFIAHLFLAGVLVVFFLPGPEASIVQTLREHPGRSFLAGFVLLVTVPVAALLLLVSVLAMPLGLALGAGYGLALFAGVLIAAFFVGDAEARWLKPQSPRTRGFQVLSLLAGVATLGVVRLLIGGAAVFFSVLFGLGALAVWGYQLYQTTTPTPSTAVPAT